MEDPAIQGRVKGNSSVPSPPQTDDMKAHHQSLERRSVTNIPDTVSEGNNAPHRNKTTAPDTVLANISGQPARLNQTSYIAHEEVGEPHSNDTEAPDYLQKDMYEPASIKTTESARFAEPVEAPLVEESTASASTQKQNDEAELTSISDDRPNGTTHTNGSIAKTSSTKSNDHPDGLDGANENGLLISSKPSSVSSGKAEQHGVGEQNNGFWLTHLCRAILKSISTMLCGRRRK